MAGEFLPAPVSSPNKKEDKMEKFQISVFAARVAGERERLGLTQAQLAQKAGTSAQAISQIEEGLRGAYTSTAFNLSLIHI